MKVSFDRDELLQKSKEELIDFFIGIILQQQKRIQELEDLLNKPKKRSHNSSIPPSSDFKSNKPKDGFPPKKLGPPKGHQSHHKTLFAVADSIHESRLDTCPDCGRDISSTSNQYIRCQWIELEEIKVKVHEERRQFSTCPCCQKTVYAPSSAADAPAPKQHIGSYLKTFVSLLQYQYGVSRGKLRDFISRFSPATVSSGSIDRILKEASCVTAPPTMIDCWMRSGKAASSALMRPVGE